MSKYAGARLRTAKPTESNKPLGLEPKECTLRGEEKASGSQAAIQPAPSLAHFENEYLMSAYKAPGAGDTDKSYPRIKSCSLGRQPSTQTMTTHCDQGLKTSSSGLQVVGVGEQIRGGAPSSGLGKGACATGACAQEAGPAQSRDTQASSWPGGSPEQLPLPALRERPEWAAGETRQESPAGLELRRPCRPGQEMRASAKSKEGPRMDTQVELFKKYVFIQSYWVSAAAHGILCCDPRTL